jgi:lysyl-tRNA synthetase class 2
MDENLSQVNSAAELSEQEQIRREKLLKLREEGRDPYVITRYDCTHTSKQILDNFDALEIRRSASRAV